MKSTRFAKITPPGVAVGLTLLAVALSTGAIPAVGQDEENRPLHIVKDCGTFSGIPGSSFCTIITSNLDELPAGTQIYYDQITGGPSAGPGYLDSNIFVYVSADQWAVGRCTLPNSGGSGVCTITDGMGALTGFNAKITVTYKTGGDGALFAWDGTYRFNSRHRN